MDWNLLIGIISLLISLITSVLVGYMTFAMLRFGAKPKLRINLVGSEGELAFLPNKVVTLKIHLENVGYWYAKPRAKNTRVYWNFDPSFEPILIRYGSTLEKSDGNVKKGKGGSKYLKAGGVHLSAGEPGEDMEAEVKIPSKPGVYPSWVSAYCDEGDCGVHRFSIKVR